MLSRLSFGSKVMSLVGLVFFFFFSSGLKYFKECLERSQLCSTGSSWYKSDHYCLVNLKDFNPVLETC